MIKEGVNVVEERGLMKNRMVVKKVMKNVNRVLKRSWIRELKDLDGVEKKGERDFESSRRIGIMIVRIVENMFSFIVGDGKRREEREMVEERIFVIGEREEKGLELLFLRGFRIVMKNVIKRGLNVNDLIDLIEGRGIFRSL
jgi:hypothetical protein